jgi:ABC-type sugar transport system permease subunit
VLRGPAGGPGTGAWLGVTLAVAVLGPLGVMLLGWIDRSRARPRALRETLAAWGFLAPATLHLAAFSFGPILFAVYLALHRWSPIEPARPFVGLANFTAVVRDPLVWVSLRNTLLYTLHVPLAMAIALGAALLLRRHSRATRVARTVFFLPYVSSAVAIALVWQWMYHPDFGLLNYLGRLVGLAPVDWLGNPRTALLAVMLVSIWVQVGYQMVVFQAGLQGIPQDYLDAARVDGASAWRRFWRVTFPLLRPVTLFVLVTGIITSFQVFTLVYVLTDGGPLHATDVLVYRIYQMAWEFLQFGPASALALLLFALLFAATWLQFRLLGRQVRYA